MFSYLDHLKLLISVDKYWNNLWTLCWIPKHRSIPIQLFMILFYKSLKKTYFFEIREIVDTPKGDFSSAWNPFLRFQLIIRSKFETRLFRLSKLQSNSPHPLFLTKLKVEKKPIQKRWHDLIVNYEYKPSQVNIKIFSQIILVYFSNQGNLIKLDFIFNFYKIAPLKEI